MKPRALLASVTALLLAAATVPAHAAAPQLPRPSAPVASITLVLRPQAPGAPAQTYTAENVRIGPGPELVGACSGSCVDYGHPTVDIDLTSRIITVMIPGNEYQLTDAELTIRTDVITGFRGLGPGRERSADSRRAEVTAEGARMTWTSVTDFAPSTVVFDIDVAAPTAPDQPASPDTDSTVIAPLPDTTAPSDAAPGTDAVASATLPAPTDADAAQPVLAEPTFTG